jgi:hypothetical protein
VLIYVSFRGSRPDEETVKDGLKELEEKNIDVSQMVEFSADHCQQAVSSRAGSSAERSWGRK